MAAFTIDSENNITALPAGTDESQSFSNPKDSLSLAPNDNGSRTQYHSIGVWFLPGLRPLIADDRRS
jgi:hypothetical protein